MADADASSGGSETIGCRSGNERRIGELDPEAGTCPGETGRLQGHFRPAARNGGRRIDGADRDDRGNWRVTKG